MGAATSSSDAFMRRSCPSLAVRTCCAACCCAGVRVSHLPRPLSRTVPRLAQHQLLHVALGWVWELRERGGGQQPARQSNAVTNAGLGGVSMQPTNNQQPTTVNHQLRVPALFNYAATSARALSRLWRQRSRPSSRVLRPPPRGGTHKNSFEHRGNGWANHSSGVSQQRVTHSLAQSSTEPSTRQSALLGD
jgi:hypothetical protein